MFWFFQTKDSSMAKTYDKPDRGNFRAFKNNSKEIGDDRPLFQGKLTLPNSKDERSFALWPYASEKDGATILSGRAGVSANSQIASYTQPAKETVQKLAVEIPSKSGGEPFKLEPDSLILFTNKSKDADNQERPDYYGFYNPGDGKLQRVAAWSQLDRYGNPMLTGSVQAYDQNKQMEQDAERPAQSTHNMASDRELEHAR